MAWNWFTLSRSNDSAVTSSLLASTKKEKIIVKQLLIDLKNALHVDYETIQQFPGTAIFTDNIVALNRALHEFLEIQYDDNAVKFRSTKTWNGEWLPENYTFCGDIGLTAFLEYLTQPMFWNDALYLEGAEAIHDIKNAKTDEELLTLAQNLQHAVAQRLNTPTADSNYFILLDDKGSDGIKSLLSDEIMEKIKENPSDWALLYID